MYGIEEPGKDPHKYKDPKKAKKIIKVIDDYFLACELTKKPMTITGLCLFIGMSKLTLAAWRRGERSFYEELSEKLEWAMLMIENNYVEKLLNSRNPTAQIFLLKSHFDYRDRDANIVNNEFNLKDLSDEQINELIKKMNSNG